MLIYDSTQYLVLVNATIIASAISMFCSALISIAYICLQVSEPSKSGRISLRCVFIASIADSINAIFDIMSVLRHGDDALCRSSSIIKILTRVTSSSLLMMVGVNLVIVFVLNVKTSYKFEVIYYLVVVVYALVTISIPIREAVLEPLTPDSHNRCWYYVNFYQIYGHSHILWMWFYGFLFLTVFIATCCSVISMIKLFREQRLLINRFTSIAASSENGESEVDNIQNRKKHHSNVFIKVIYRCIIYPLVPLICNACGFAFQIILLHPTASPDFVLSAIDTTLGCLQGFFLAIVFFSDPTMTSFIREKAASWKLNYLDEFTEVYTYEDGHVEIVSKGKQDFKLTTPDAHMSIVHIDKEFRRESSTATILPIDLLPDTELTLQNSNITLPPPVLIANHNIPSPTAEKKPEPCTLPISKVPMRQINTQSRICSRLSQTIQPQSPSLFNNFDGNDHPQYTPSTLIDPDMPNMAFKPYKYPRFARLFHWVLVKFNNRNFKSQGQSTVEQTNALLVHPLQTR
ncbi:hypothetical protein K501DRAFT_315097 [Backusella circina FSU 941]|nr:hypothetical protein K501DRAFT_315097 [Backusella circina FSU 941]